MIVVSSTTVDMDVNVEVDPTVTSCVIVSDGGGVASAATVWGGGDTVTVVRRRTVELERTVEVESMFSVVVEATSVSARGKRPSDGRGVVRLMMSVAVLRGILDTFTNAIKDDCEFSTVNSPALAEVLDGVLVGEQLSDGMEEATP